LPDARVVAAGDVNGVGAVGERGVGVALVAVRFAASDQFAYFNLVWNLFLAWLPLVFAFFANQVRVSRGALFLCAALWLLFLPNSPYLVTDLVLLKPRPPVSLWFDILLVQSFVLTGLLLGFLVCAKVGAR